MLTLNLGGEEEWDSKENLFKKTPDEFVTLEDSLYAIARWESKWGKAWYDPEVKTRTPEEFADYIQCMAVDCYIPIEKIKTKHLEKIQEYMTSKHTATTIRDTGGGSGGKVTSEVMYAQMSVAKVSWEAQYWNINRLQMLLRVISEMHSEKKKIPRREILKTNAQLNAERKKQLNSKG